MVQPNDNALFFAARRTSSARIHAVPAPKSSIARFVDAIESPVVLVDREGLITTMNGPARDCLVGRPGAVARQAIEARVRLALGDRRRNYETLPNRAYTIDVGHDRFVITVVAAGTDLATQNVGAMVTLRREHVGARESSLNESSLMERFGLTAQEARVAILLVDQRTNREIAGRLGVSVHTARHHTERVLSKLHIHSRYDVKRVIA